MYIDAKLKLSWKRKMEKRPSFFFALLCWFLYAANPCTCSQNDTDRLALLSFKQAIERDPFQVLSSWNNSQHHCDWHGVFCSRRHPGRVIALILRSRGLVGPLSPHIGNLSFLRVINFQNNTFYGEIPQEIGRLQRVRHLILSNNSFAGNIPANLSRCSNLLFLDLIDNKLIGNIPAELGSLPKLGALGLAANNLTGRIPPSIGNLSSLYQISIRTNNLHGQIPEEFSRLGKLKDMLFAENSLSGEIPPGLYNISSIEIFNMNQNQLHGRIPADVGLTLPRLSSFVLSYNKFTGSIPVSLSNASGLMKIVLFSNNLTGSIPKYLGMMPNLQHVILAVNQLKGDLSFIDSLTNSSRLLQINVARNLLNGSIPKSIANLSKTMWLLGLSENQLQGTVPLGLDNLVNLRILQLAWNLLSGPLLTDFGKFQKLQYLTLSDNNFGGAIPSSLSNLTFLSVLYMRNNNLHGTIPPALGNLRSLIELDLRDNSLNGSIPPEVISLFSLSFALSLSHNQLTGSVPLEVGSMQNILLLDLSDNRLSGTIPSSIGKCLNLEGLFLEGNSFEGEIPQALSTLQGLRELDISRNNLSGKIPDSLVELDGLNLLNISFNNLEGEVPKLGIFLNSSAVSLLGNDNLCGGIADLKLPPCPFPKSNKNKFSSSLKISISVVGAALFLLLLVGFLFFWRRKRMSRSKGISMPSFNLPFLRISYAELFKATDGFSTSNVIGSGSYSSVYRGILEATGNEIAVKVLNLQRTGASQSFMSECKALKNIRHRNLIKILSACSSIDFEGNDFKALIYEFMPNGSLDKWLHPGNAREDGHMNLMQRLNIAIDIASAIEYLHNGCSSTIVHGDLKPSNVLLDNEMTAHVGDFGLAKFVSAISGGADQHLGSSSLAIKGTIGYVAPEYGMGDMVSIEGDIYSYGILLLEMFTGKKPTDDSFKDGLNLHVYTERSLPDKVMEVVDPSIDLSNDGRESLLNCMVSVMRIGVACSEEVPAERMKMVDVIRELHKIKDAVAEKYSPI
ncbi:probable LRR receptor-like serine/threonine-protein kinase At3g47570 [Manihot esculenta]|uniref:Uncharacterized protein n=3 Tax=Manihot esculenta TaxID=3983 RepID=A0ACB7I952_MANES|nr:probable LRR receptor-like serine/threonine-protein kinase At3g47570 [Manihot esculenta]KAG8660876.1 hypothetical protein MANES_02G203300v8 [Manihot esculenta]KAG8660877.1 hypothetical protein MANES_02G203300v8 [Manihot esculenta]